ncbi:MAG TPA: hypothetical protein VEQ10_10145, partial [Vicinamibacteria bacterium]|nr:hypothetical protein [Vicinamibacteria bacterium]
MTHRHSIRSFAAAGLALAVAAAASSSLRVSADATPPYRNPRLSVEERVNDLVFRMTLEEKVGQLLMLDARPDDLSFVNTRQPGSLLHVLG